MQGLTAGYVDEQLPLLQPNEALVRAHELREGQPVSLQSALACTVSFAAGQERQVLLGLHGLPQVQPTLCLAVHASPICVVARSCRPLSYNCSFPGDTLCRAPCSQSTAKRGSLLLLCRWQTALRRLHKLSCAAAHAWHLQQLQVGPVC